MSGPEEEKKEPIIEPGMKITIRGSHKKEFIDPFLIMWDNQKIRSSFDAEDGSNLLHLLMANDPATQEPNLSDFENENYSIHVPVTFIQKLFSEFPGMELHENVSWERLGEDAQILYNSRIKFMYALRQELLHLPNVIQYQHLTLETVNDNEIIAAISVVADAVSLLNPYIEIKPAIQGAIGPNLLTVKGYFEGETIFEEKVEEDEQPKKGRYWDLLTHPIGLIVKAGSEYLTDVITLGQQLGYDEDQLKPLQDILQILKKVQEKNISTTDK